MTAADFASLLNARRIGRGKWIAKCPVHGDHRPSLSIGEGRKRPILFVCMSQGCSPESILQAMGLTWQDILGPRAVTPEIRHRLADQERIDSLERKSPLFSMLQVLEPRKRNYWATAQRNTEYEICMLRSKLGLQIGRGWRKYEETL